MSLLPDYSLSTAEVYLSFTVQCLFTDQNLDLLSAVDAFGDGRRIRDLPSWVPDFSVGLMPRIQPLVQPSAYREDIWNAAAGAQPNINWDPADSHVLRLDGLLVDTVAAVSTLRANTRGLKPLHEEWQRMTEIAVIPTTSSSRDRDRINTYTKGILEIKGREGSDSEGETLDEQPCSDIWPGVDIFSMRCPKSPPTVNSWSHLLHSLIYPDAARIEEPKDQITGSWESYLAFLAFLRLQQSGTDFSTDTDKLLADWNVQMAPNILGKKHQIVTSMRLQVIGRRIVYTESGHVVFAPEQTEVGDRICILRGGKVPYVLREKEKIARTDNGEHERFKFVGECFCHAMMVGQMIEHLGDDAWVSLVLE